MFESRTAHHLQCNECVWLSVATGRIWDCWQWRAPETVVMTRPLLCLAAEVVPVVRRRNIDAYPRRR